MEDNIKFFTAKSKSAFEKHKNNIPKKSITFIEGALEIYADGQLYNTISIPSTTPVISKDKTLIATINNKDIYAKIDAAPSADMLNVKNVGNSTTPVYFSNGVPVACSVSTSTTTGSLPLSGGIMTGPIQGSNNLQLVSGTYITFRSGTQTTDPGVAIDFDKHTLRPVDVSKDIANLGLDSHRWLNGYFSGNVSASSVTVDSIIIGDAVIKYNKETGKLESNKNIEYT